MKFIYTGDNKVINVINIKPTSMKQLDNKYPKFDITIAGDFGTRTLRSNTKKLSDNKFRILDGYGVMTNQIIEGIEEG